ncbi:MAG: molybdopterin biosynthesis protein [Treponema sp.]|jgi:putative molybdopterin biosynthesis protein|nr:molybdopterin biosynthesis protein [Treponema sp.]
MAKRNLYLTNIPVEEALAKYLAALGDHLVPGFEEIPVTESLDRVTRQAVYARCCSPLYNAAAMDGIAVIAAATAGARENNPVTLVHGRDFVVTDTGDPIYPPYDAVIMAEDIVELAADTVQIREAAVAWQYIRPIGEDIVTGEMILPGRHRIRPIDIGVLLAGGITRIEVYTKPAVAIFPTGTEIVEPDIFSRESSIPGPIIESNTRMFEAQTVQGGGAPTRFAPIPDDYDLIREKIAKAAAEFDMVIVNAGSSAGTGDFTVHVLRELGEVIVHGVAMKPGKPVILAMVNNKPVIGIPGYPVSAYLAWEKFAAPVLGILAGRVIDSEAATVEAVIAKRIVSSLKHREYVRVKVGRVDGKLVASPLARGAGAAMSLVRADGFCVIDQNSEGIEAGAAARVELYRSLSEIERTVVSIGSHDLILDVIADMMAGGNTFLASAHVGSMAGLMALLHGECHIAPTHLLNGETGEYNVSYINEIFKETPMALIKGVGRIQGLIIPKENPLGITGVADLVSCRYINRQRGAGTRFFLDFCLKQKGIAPEQINGYDHEAATHMAVAAAVESGNADAGMGISSAAAALGLGFIALGNEEYDFAVHPRFLELPQVEAFIACLKSEAFHRRLTELGGYTREHCGEIVRIQGISSCQK